MLASVPLMLKDGFDGCSKSLTSAAGWTTTSFALSRAQSHASAFARSTGAGPRVPADTQRTLAQVASLGSGAAALTAGILQGMEAQRDMAAGDYAAGIKGMATGAMMASSGLHMIAQGLPARWAETLQPNKIWALACTVAGAALATLTPSPTAPAGG